MKLHTAISAQYIKFNEVSITCIGRQSASTEINPPENLLGWLNRILVAEIRCMLRFRSLYYGTLNDPKGIASIFLIYANEKMMHIDAIALLITQLGGVPDFSLKSASIYDYQYSPAHGSLPVLIEQSVKMDRIAILSYRAIISRLEPYDLATASVLTTVLAADERRVAELVAWLGQGVQGVHVTPPASASVSSINAAIKIMQ